MILCYTLAQYSHGENSMKSTVSCSVFFLTTACESTIISKLKVCQKKMVTIKVADQGSCIGQGSSLWQAYAAGWGGDSPPETVEQP